MPGHLFVIQGDLTKLACDGVLIPCDFNLDVTDVWAEFLPEGHAPGAQPGWLRLPDSTARDASHVGLDDVSGVRVGACVVVAPGEGMSVEHLASRVSDSVRRLREGLQPQGGRVIPLIALPLFGTGEGGLHHRRGEVIDALLPQLGEIARDTDVDVALVLRDARDYAAVQARRRDVPSQWAQIGDLKGKADELGQKAAAGELSLFIGSGVSLPLGMPTWDGLLSKLAGLTTQPGLGSDEPDLLARAEIVVKRLDTETYENFMTECFATTRHALGHALLADLRPRQMVTTNYDGAMELALEGVLGQDSVDVLTRHLAHASRPWLLKLHGDVAEPGSIVLTTSDYEDLTSNRRALHGVVQSLMLTSHLLFVGFGLRDDDFLGLSKSVAHVRSGASSAKPTIKAGTAIALHPEAVSLADLRDHLTLVSMTGSQDEVGAARTLEIFLDRMAWRAANDHQLSSQYLLDERYDAAFQGQGDRALREALRTFETSLDEAALSSTAWPVVRQMLKDLGSGHNRLTS